MLRLQAKWPARDVLVGQHFCALVAMALALAACGGPSSSSTTPFDASSLPTIEHTPTERASPSPTASREVDTSARRWFPTVAGFDFADSPEQARSFEHAANESLAGTGTAQVQSAAIATRGSERVTVVAYALSPEGSASEQDLFGAVLEGMAQGLGAAAQSDIDGQAYVVESGDTVAITGPWAEGPYTVFLLATGSSREPTEEVYRALLDAGPAG
jgi:hypothetical protein